MGGKVGARAVLRVRAARIAAAAVLGLAAAAALLTLGSVASTSAKPSVVLHHDGKGILTAAKRRKARPLRATTSGVRLTSKVVGLSPSLVRRELIGVSANGTFAFRGRGGAIARLRKGKVMVIPGINALKVTGLSRAHGRILVHTVEAKLPDVLKSGRITFSGAPNFKTGAVFGTGLPTERSASTDFKPLGGLLRDAGTTRAMTARGSFRNIGYALTFTPTSAQRIDIAGDLCYTAAGGNCERGFPGLSFVGKLSGYVTVGNLSGSVSFSPLRGLAASLAMGQVSGRLALTYHVTNRDGRGGNPPVVQLPFTLGIPIPTTGVPLYVRVQFIVSMSFGILKGSSEYGGVIWKGSAGNESVRLAGNAVTTSGSGSTSADGQILDQSNGGVPPSFSPTVGGSVLFLREKVGLGLGYDAAYGIAFMDFVEGVGQEMGSAVAGQLCSAFYSTFSIGAGVEAQVGSGLLAIRLTKRHQLGAWKLYANDPGCPPIPKAPDVFRPTLAPTFGRSS